MSFKKKILAKILILPLILSLNGCVYLVVGGLGALGGYVVSRDTIEGLTQNNVVNVWDAAIEIVSIMGTIQEQSQESGIIIAKINNASVTITITALSETTIKLNVKARKAYMPRISVAQDVYVKIMSYLNE